MGVLERLSRFLNNFFIDVLEENAAFLLAMGGPGSGKTVAVSSAFVTLANGVQAAPEGPCLRVNAETVNSAYTQTAQTLTDVYNGMASEGTLPVGTSENQVYRFRLEKNGAGICKICYLDYRGGLRTDSEPSREEVQGFQDVLKRAAVLAFVIPGDLLQEFSELKRGPHSGMDRGNLARNIEICKEVNHIRTQMEAANLQNPGAPVLFYVTKADRIRDRKAFPALLERFLQEWDLPGARRMTLGCCSTLGDSICIDQNHRIQEGFRPKGFELPMLLAAAWQLDKLATEWAAQEAREAREAIAPMEQERGAAVARRAELEGQIRTKLLRVFGAERKELTEVKEKIDRLTRQIDERRTQSAQSRERNPKRRHVLDILDYIEKTYPDTVLYWDEAGKRRPLRRFFSCV